MGMPQHAVKLSDIRIDGGTQPRTEINAGLVAEYAEAMAMGVTFPPIVVFFDGVDHWLADGFHRYHAAKRADWRDIGAEVHTGTQRDAVLFSVGANAAHGARRTPADKRKAVLTLLNDEEWCQWSKVEIARQCGVSTELVLSVVRAHMPETASERKYTTKHGTVATMQTENIGKLKMPDRSKAAVEARRGQIRAMAEDGYSIAQIASAVGIGEQRVVDVANEHGIDLARARVVSNTLKHDSNRIVEHIVMDAENLTADVGLVTFTALDRARLEAWISSLAQSQRSLGVFIRQLKEQQKHGEAA